MSSFDAAWNSITKAPFRELGNPHRNFEGVDYLYSGGHANDEPSYWTEDLDLALGYAMFGSAIPRREFDDMNFETHEDDFKRTIGGMRETVPTIWRLKQPTDTDVFFEPDQSSNALYGGWHDESIQPEKMPKEEVEDLITSRILGPDSKGAAALWDIGAETTGSFFSLDDVLNHSIAGLERLRTGKPGSRLDVPAEAIPYSQFALTDWGHDV